MTKATANEGVGAYVKRSLTGATFLALEHTLHKVVLVIVAGLVAMGLATGLGMWMGTPTSTSMMDSWATSPFMMPLAQMGSMSALMVVAGLVVFAPWLVVLDRRVKAEMAKRRGFDRRLAYRLPLYVTMGAVAVIKLALAACAVWVVLYSLATMGQVSAEAVGQLYREQFVPTLVTLLVFASVGWYLLRVAQGKTMGHRFNAMFTVLALLLAVALFVTATVNLQNDKAQAPSATPSLEDYLKDYENNDYLDNFDY